MKLLNKAFLLSSAIAFSSIALADEASIEEKIAKKSDEVKELHGFVQHGMHSGMGSKTLKGIELTEEQLAAFELGLTEIHQNMPALGEASMEEIIQARVAAHELTKELLDSILTDEQKAELEAKQAELEAKKAEREAAMAEKRAEFEAKKAEREAQRAAWEAMTDEEKEAAKAAKKAEREAKEQTSDSI